MNVAPLQAQQFRPKLMELARKRKPTIAIGLGAERDEYPKKIAQDALRAVENGVVGKVRLVGAKDAVERVTVSSSNVEAIATRSPESDIVEMVVKREVDAALRGTLPARSVIAEVRNAFNLNKVHRVALLETHDNAVFFFAPVGVDEGNDLEDQLLLVEGGIKLQGFFGVKPVIAVLSGGRLEDYGRSKLVNETINRAESLAKRIKDEFHVEAFHQGILIEDAVRKANFIIAPDGVTGNMIFRALTLIGGGNAFGAPIVDVLPKVFVDVSRAMRGYLDSIALAAALANLVP